MIEKVEYRIRNANGTFLNANTGLDSWFTYKQAKGLVNYSIGQQIRWIKGEFDYGEAL